jgi:hypothetical protein
VVERFGWPRIAEELERQLYEAVAAHGSS